MLCLGFGKSAFMTTVLLAISKTDREVFTNIIKMLYPNHPKQKFFPISYYITSIGQQDYPFGWVKIEDSNESAYELEYELPNYNSTQLKKDNLIQGVLIERGSPAIVKISVDGVTVNLKANNLSKYEQMNNTILEVGNIYTFQITAIKETIIKDMKIVSHAE